MPLDPRTPVLVGVSQLEQRVDDPLEGAEPLDLMVAAAEAAAEDAGSPALLRSIDSIYVIRGIWRYQNPARAVAERIGSPGARTLGTPFGGNMVQSSLSHAARAIQAGQLDVALLCGAEHGRSQARARRAGIKLQYADAPGSYDEMVAEEKPMSDPAEQARGILRPIQMYPIFENALRYARGESIEAHGRRISELWEGFNRVARDNPHAWLREPVSAEEIRTPSDANRPVSFPYTKLMNSNSNVDQAAGLIVCSLETARRAGVPEDRLVFPRAGTDAHDHLMVSSRADLHSSPAIRIAGARALELAKASIDDVAHLDVYSCFPSAVQVASQELGVPEGRPLTVTGGLTFGGGPMNNYVMHSIARMAEVLRADPGSLGLVTANGGYLTKHAFGVYSTEPADGGFLHDDLQKQVDELPRRESVTDHEGAVEIESYTVMYDGEGAAVGHTACLLPDGRRTWANTEDRDVARAMTTEEFCGRAAHIDGAGNFTVTS